MFELRLGELGDKGDYEQFKSHYSPEKRTQIADSIQTAFLDGILNQMRERGPRESTSEKAANKRLQELRGSDTPLVVIDFPTRGISSEANIPKEIGDALRKYFVMPTRGVSKEDNVFHIVRRLHQQLATLRVFAAPELHELLLRYMDTPAIQGIVGDTLPGGAAMLQQ